MIQSLELSAAVKNELKFRWSEVSFRWSIGASFFAAYVWCNVNDVTNMSSSGIFCYMWLRQRTTQMGDYVCTCRYMQQQGLSYQLACHLHGRGRHPPRPGALRDGLWPTWQALAWAGRGRGCCADTHPCLNLFHRQNHSFVEFLRDHDNGWENILPSRTAACNSTVTFFGVRRFTPFSKPFQSKIELLVPPAHSCKKLEKSFWTWRQLFRQW